jgi:hypothetical protein
MWGRVGDNGLTYVLHVSLFRMWRVDFGRGAVGAWCPLLLSVWPPSFKRQRQRVQPARTDGQGHCARWLNDERKNCVIIGPFYDTLPRFAISAVCMTAAAPIDYA